MRKVVSHTILTLDGVAVFDAVADTIAELRDTKEVLDDFFGKVADEDAVLLGRVTYQEWGGLLANVDQRAVRQPHQQRAQIRDLAIAGGRAMGKARERNARRG